eukprot:6186468-Pleurochrysis_carterae.AAC.3
MSSGAGSSRAQAPGLRPTARRVLVDWGKYGKYELVAQEDGVLSGSVLGKPDDWRKAVFVREHSPAEQLVSASAWELSHGGGKPFRVEVRDGTGSHSASSTASLP